MYVSEAFEGEGVGQHELMTLPPLPVLFNVGSENQTRTSNIM